MFSVAKVAVPTTQEVCPPQDPGLLPICFDQISWAFDVLVACLRPAQSPPYPTPFSTSLLPLIFPAVWAFHFNCRLDAVVALIAVSAALNPVCALPPRYVVQSPAVA